MASQRKASLVSPFVVAVMALLAFHALAGTASADTIALSWDPSPETDVIGYIVHVGTEAGVLTQRHDVGLTTFWPFTEAEPGQLYCFAVSAYASSRVESLLSNEVCGYGTVLSLADPGPQVTTRGEHVTLQLEGNDPAHEPLVYAADNLPPGLSLQPTTGFISGAPTEVGTYSVMASTSTGRATASQAFTWTVVASDIEAPVIQISRPTDAPVHQTENSTLTISGTASDNASLARVTWVNNRGGSGTARGTGRWRVAEVTLEPGTNLLTVTAYDSSGNSSSDTLTVTAGSGTPTLASIADQSATVGLATTLQLTGTDPDDDALTYGASNLPPGLAVSPSTGLIAGVPAVAGSYTVTASVSDATSTDSKTFVWTVIAIHDDTYRPTLRITTPTDDHVFRTSDTSVTIGGTASDDQGVIEVRWVNAFGDSGVAVGTTAWSATIDLHPGINLITVTARDAAGNVAVDFLFVLPYLQVSLSADRVSPQRPGTPITFVASTSGGTAPYDYRWRLFDGSRWTVLREWSDANVQVWIPRSGSGQRIEVSVRSRTGSRAVAEMPFEIDD